MSHRLVAKERGERALSLALFFFPVFFVFEVARCGRRLGWLRALLAEEHAEREQRGGGDRDEEPEDPEEDPEQNGGREAQAGENAESDP